VAAAVDAVDHQVAPFAVLVSEPAGDDAPDDGSGLPNLRAKTSMYKRYIGGSFLKLAR
jgi:hypothetical protein